MSQKAIKTCVELIFLKRALKYCRPAFTIRSNLTTRASQPRGAARILMMAEVVSCDMSSLPKILESGTVSAASMDDCPVKSMNRSEHQSGFVVDKSTRKSAPSNICVRRNVAPEQRARISYGNGMIQHGTEL